MTSLIKLVFVAGATLLLPIQAVLAEPPPAKPLPTAADEEATPTVIDSDHLEMITLEEETQFVFSNNVQVTATNMKVFCDRLEVYAGRQNEPRPEGAARGDPANELGRIQRIFAIGNVRIEQEESVATSGRAEVYPQEGMIILTDSPVVRNEQGRVSGERILLYQGEVRVVVEGGQSQPSRVVLPTLPDLGASAERSARQNEPARN